MIRLTLLLACAAVLAGCPGATPCTTVRDCANTQRCVNGGCADPGSTPGQLGESCRGTSDCAASLTCSSPQNGYPGGYCTAACVTAPCASGACTQVGPDTICAAKCANDSECRTGYACCASLNNVCVPLGGCIPACTRPVVASTLEASIPGARVLALGSHKVGDIVPFDVPAGTASVTIVHQAELANLTVTFQGQVLDNSAVPLTVSFPDGGVAYDDTVNLNGSADGGFDYSGKYAFYGGGTPSTSAFTFPNTTASLAAGVPAGTWKFVVNDFARECVTAGCSDGGTDANTYDVSVLLKPGGARSNIDVAFYIVADLTTLSGQPLTDVNAKTDPQVQRMVDTYTKLIANSSSGITVRSVTFYYADAASRARFGTNVNATQTGPCDELDQMFLLSGGHPGNTVNVFLAQSLRASAGGGGTIVGIDGTIPGPASLNGTVHSGAVVSAADIFAATQQSCPPGGFSINGCGPDRVAYIAAHETGHFLGLFHTTEQNGSDYDPLTDTAKCPCLSCAAPADRSRCADSPGANAPFLSADLCLKGDGICDGGDNLMFWQLEAGVSAGRISAQQAQVMKLNPAVQ